MGVLDLDLLDYARWARNSKGLAQNTVRIRVDVLERLHTYIDTPLRQAQTGQLLRFEQVAIAGRAPETMRAYVCHIRAFYRWAIQVGIVPAGSDPSTMLTLPIVPRHLPRPIGEDDLAHAIATARPKMRAMLILGSYAGLRCCEIAGLDWADLLREPDGTAFLHVRHGKGSKERTVELGQTVMQALRGLGIKRRGPMFLGTEGRQIRPKSVSSVGNTYLRRRGIDATMHQLRHRYGSLGYQLSHDLRLMQEQMGHSSPNTTAGYVRVSAQAAAAMVAAMDRLNNKETA